MPGSVLREEDPQHRGEREEVELGATDRVRQGQARGSAVMNRNTPVQRPNNILTTERCINMRWVLCYKESGAPKARIVLIGHQDPDVEGLATASPTMSRRTRQAVLQHKCCRKWQALKGDVRAAFLQGASSEEDRKLFAKPVPELACEMGLKEGECVQILKSCYGLITAPAPGFEMSPTRCGRLGWSLGSRTLAAGGSESRTRCRARW